MSIPDYHTCCRLLEAYRVPEHIVDHSRQVAAAGVWLGDELCRRGFEFDRRLLLSAGLLHDIAKMQSLEDGTDHAELGARWLEREGFPEVAEIVRNHVRLQTDLDGPLVAREIIFYADKRVRHREIVSVRERMQDLRQRYGRNDFSSGWLKNLETLTLGVEKKIFAHLDLSPGDLAAGVGRIKIS